MISEQEIQDNAIKDGKDRDEVLFSFKAVGITEIILAGWLIILGIIAAIVAAAAGSYNHGVSLVCSGVWCGIFSLPAGIMSYITSQKVSYFNVGWSMICSIISSVFMFVLLILSFFAAVEHVDVASVFNIMLVIFDLAQFSLNVYSSIVFGQLFANYPYHTFPGNELFSCYCCYNRSPNNFAHVMYSNIAPKKHDY